MTAYCTPNDGFTANNALFSKKKLASYARNCMPLQLIVYANIKYAMMYYRPT